VTSRDLKLNRFLSRAQLLLLAASMTSETNSATAAHCSREIGTAERVLAVPEVRIHTLGGSVNGRWSAKIPLPRTTRVRCQVMPEVNIPWQKYRDTGIPRYFVMSSIIVDNYVKHSKNRRRASTRLLKIYTLLQAAIGRIYRYNSNKAVKLRHDNTDALLHLCKITDKYGSNERMLWSR